MESLVLNLQSKNQIKDYIVDNYLIRYEADIFNEMLSAIENGAQEHLDWFRSFGDSLRAIAMNLHAYRKGLEFGFTEIAFDKYGWFKRPQWLDTEEHAFGDTRRYGNHSTFTIGHGPNGLWTYAMSYSFGCAGGGYTLSVYDKKFNHRDQAFTAALNDLKMKMTSRVGSTDTTNDKQPIILATLRDIEKVKIAMVQLSLF
ncbi:hypothetical protein SAMN05216464_10885 [Mucilaginibacter pineti]|uniref:Uncharacterized protein n=1 Tax=Mucilaginibacter pineti TaxID=1391627 RepID=A0A1G7ELZ1_9SPHI|nr:hypothetical protein [Mucilaginibacter pineti]SDE64708.1 hypothetical protein SAMN05216464_10885 [Mucilaginibacter pineti]